MLRKSLAGLFIVLGMGMAAPAWSAGYAYVQGAVHLRSGPRIGYPIVMVLGMGSRVYVHGCVSDYTWCDVTADGMRGWVSASYLDYPYGGGYVPIVDYGPALGIGIISFSIISYWGLHYRHRPWYGERHHYRSRFGLHGRDGRPPRRWATPRGQRPRPMARPRAMAPQRQTLERRRELQRQQQRRRSLQRQQQRRAVPPAQRAREQQRQRARIHQPPGASRAQPRQRANPPSGVRQQRTLQQRQMNQQRRTNRQQQRSNRQQRQRLDQ